ncbi:hypothetical protein GR268_36650 [Rhizobium leguminosarum]|nr:hypothetical protein [Rhizobium leguminosarum]
MDFDLLWNSYPQDYSPCRLANGDPGFANQCAIRFGLALINGGIDVSRFDGACCWHGHGSQHLLRGEEIADFMKRHPAIFGKVVIRAKADETTFVGRRGIIFCRNFWGPGNQGDHIDLWNRNHMKTGDPGYIGRSEETWFWEIDATTPRGQVRKKTSQRRAPTKSLPDQDKDR